MPFREMSVYQRWAFVGHACFIVGSLALSVAALLRVVDSGALSDQQSFTFGQEPNRNNHTPPGRSSGYFDL